jgi:hypothetical protein
LPDGDAVSIVTVGPAARVALMPSRSTNGSDHLAFMGDSTATDLRPYSGGLIKRREVL